MKASSSFADRLNARKGELANTSARQDLIGANLEMIERAVRGQGPDKATAEPQLGARMAVNIAATHVGSFCQQGYKNAYDLGKFNAHVKKARLGENIPVPTRVIVDEALTKLTKCQKEVIYFGAVELNGTGVRFYGDLCLILDPKNVPGTTVILESNSYDLVRPPNTLAELDKRAAAACATWQSGISDIAALKIMATRLMTERRLTTGQISDAVLQDEDYLEILKVTSFAASDLQEVRSSASDTAAENAIGERLRLGLSPSAAEANWRKHRRAAVRALTERHIKVRIVTSSGRIR